MCHLRCYVSEDVTLDATWQKDGNVFCFNLYIDIDYISEKVNTLIHFLDISN